MNIYAVVGVWAGCAQDVKLCRSEEEAQKEKEQLLEEYNIQGIDLENSDHDIKVFEILPQMMTEKLRQALQDGPIWKCAVCEGDNTDKGIITIYGVTYCSSQCALRDVSWQD